MESSLKDILRGKVAIVGIGNIMRRDDGMGPAVVEKLKDRTKAICIDAGVSPENYIGKIAAERPDTVLLIDAVHLGLEPGEYNILKKDRILKSGLMTHDISPKEFIAFLERETKADIYLLGVQPEDVSFGDIMSLVAEKAVKEIAESITEALDARDAYNRADNKRHI